jgi:hypothetical protein
MNLDENPTQEQLRALIASCDDEAGGHVVWVDPQGGVHVTQLGWDITPGGWAAKMGDRIQFRYETFQCGNGYVGPEAAQDDEYVSGLFRSLLHDWQRGACGYIDY